MEEKVLRCNRKAMDCLNSGEYRDALSYLNQAQKLLRGVSLTTCSKIMGITLNNLGCYYKAVGKPNDAALYLTQAIEIEKKSATEVNNLAATHLNLCAIESMMGYHLKALENSLKAIHLLKDVYKHNEKATVTFVSAHFNASCEYKALLRNAESRRILEIGLNISKENLGFSHFLTEKLLNFEFSLRGKEKINSVNITPIKSIRSSTAATTIKKRNFKQSCDKSFDTRQNSLCYRMSKQRISPLMDRKEMFCKTEKKKKFRIKKVKVKKVKEKMCILEYQDKGNDKEVQVVNDKEVQVGNDQEKAAVLIQKTWKMFITRKNVMKKIMSEEILQAEKKMNRAYDEFERLKSKKLLYERKCIVKQIDLVPVPYHAKLHHKQLISSRYILKKPTKISIKPGFPIQKVLKIQSQFRKYLAMKKFVLIKSSIITIQKNWKRCQAMRKYRQTLHATKKIQAFFHENFPKIPKTPYLTFGII